MNNAHKTNSKKIVFAIILTLIIVFSAFFCVFCYLFPKKYEKIIKTECDKYLIDYALIYAIINAESGFNQNAKSKKGAMGLMQIMPQTAMFIAESLGENFENDSLLFDPEVNIRYGVYYIDYLSKKFDSNEAIICSYNAGETVVRSWLSNSEYSTDKKTLKVIPYPETNNYLKKVLKNYKVYKKIIWYNHKKPFNNCKKILNKFFSLKIKKVF